MTWADTSADLAGIRMGHPQRGEVHVQFDDSIIQDMAEVGVTMAAWEYRTRWYGEDEPIARAAELEEKPAPLTDGSGSG